MENRLKYSLVALLIVMGALARLLPHPANFTPVTAMALLGGAWFGGAAAYLLPLGILVLSDAFLGFHPTVPFVYAGFLLCARLGRGLESAPAGRLGLSAAAGSVLFYALTNFGVWATTALYAKDAPGLAQCYVAALPFFRNALAGDLVYTFALFGVVRLAFPLRREAIAAA